MRRFALIVVLLVNTCGTTLAQEKAAPVRPRVGLALSGGGALGLAHIGVLKYFEEHHIPVDAVAGTSMGGLVGGFYATGMDSADLQQLARSISWPDILRATPKYEDRPIAEKQDWNRTDADTTLRFKRNLSLPTGLNPGQPLALLLSRHTAAYADLNSFDDLPTPFRCVATDLISGGPFTLRRGPLPLAMRATMAIPGIFTPVAWEDRLLVDGGAVDNIPVDVAREMNSDVVIAVNLETAPVDPKSLNTLTGVLKQLVSVVVLQNERRSLSHADLVISVQLHQFGSTDYVRAEDLIAAGYKAAQSMAASLKTYELSDNAWQQYRNERQRRIRPLPHTGRVVAVHSPQPDIRVQAENELARKLPGIVDQKKIEETLNGITAATSLPSAYYGWKNDSAHEGYRILLEERPEGGEVLVRPSLLMQVSGGEPTRASLLLSTVTVTKDAYKSRLLADASIGFDPGIRMEYYHPIDGQPYFVAPGFLVQRTHVDNYSDSKLNQFTRDRFAGSLFAGLGTWRFVQWRVGAIAGYDHHSSEITTDGVPSRSGAFTNAETNLVIDTQDSRIIPTRGTRLSAKLGYSIRDYSYPYFDGKVSHFKTIKSGLGLFGFGRGASSFGRKLPYFDQFTTAGISELPAYRFQEFHANTLAIAGAGAYLPVPKFHVSGWKPVVAMWHQVGRLDLGSAGWQTHQSTSLGVWGSSPLGPAGLVLSSDEKAHLRLRFVFGIF